MHIVFSKGPSPVKFARALRVVLVCDEHKSHLPTEAFRTKLRTVAAARTSTFRF
jgi:hypothetical protein